MKHTFRATAAIAIAALAVGLVGCTSSSSGTSTDAAETGEITVWDFLSASWPEWKAAQDDADAAFEASHPGVTIKRIDQPSDTATYNQLLQSAVRSGTAPDVLLLQPFTGGVLSLTDALLPLNGVVPDDVLDSLSGLDAATLDDQVYGLPTGLQGNVMFYNKKIFTEAGLDPEKAPTTIDEIENAAEKVKAAGYTGIAGGNKEGEINGWMYTYLWPAFGDEPATIDPTNPPQVDDPTSVKVAQAYVDMVDKGLFTDGMQSIPLSDYEAPFRNSQAGMIISLATNAASLGESIGQDNIGVIQSPESSFLPYVPALVWSVTKSSKLPTVSAEYVESLTGPDISEAMYTSMGWIPTSSAISPDASDVPAVQEITTEIQDTQTGPPPSIGWSPAVAAEYKKQLQLVITGDQTVEQALAAVQAVADQ